MKRCGVHQTNPHCPMVVVKHVDFLKPAVVYRRKKFALVHGALFA